jgi:S-DNA-T family DNA segregation ATPase FtsK/SpoIIIE
MIWDMSGKILLLTWEGLGPFLMRWLESPFQMGLSTLALLWGYKWVAMNWYHLRFMNWIWPSLFSGKFLNWFVHFRPGVHFLFMLISTVWIFIIFLGGKTLREKKKFKEMFEGMGLVNRIGQIPKLIRRNKIDEYRDYYLFLASGIGLEQFEGKKSWLEASVGKRIESIERANDLRYVEIIFTTKELPAGVEFQDVIKKCSLEEGYFIVGETIGGVLTSRQFGFPHMLIAGTTGSGKSVFFKQSILGLLKSTEHLQVYFIDLKKGLEASDYKEMPNVAIAKDASEALHYLEKIQDEMNKRFKYLESKNLKSIEPKRDKKDFIVVAVDEAAELYAEKSKTDEDYETVTRAQEITNSIARLGRAAGIHLILATQKVHKESINTIIQENISVRMCFRMNTLQGSMQVLGNKDAMEIPCIPGRGIFQRGNEQYEVQVPYVSGYEIQDLCKDIAEKYKSGVRKLNQPMIGQNAVSDSKEFRESFINQKGL